MTFNELNDIKLNISNSCLYGIILIQKWLPNKYPEILFEILNS